jgi:predicted Zn finger-like uncharacterized protein
MRGIMDIACPNCAAAYEIDDASVTLSGRKVRCAACSKVWRVYPVGYEPALQQEETQVVLVAPAQTEGASEVQAKSISLAGLETDQDNGQAENNAPLPRRVKWAKDKKPEKQTSWAKGTLFSWHLVAITAAVFVVGLGLHQRERIVQFLPQVAKIYAAVGLQVNLRGIEIKGVSSRVIDDNGVSVLVVDGDLFNITGRKLDVPRLRFAVRGQDGQEIYVWSAQADRSSLQPGEVLNFRRRLAAPPQEGKDVSVRFVTRADVTSGIK